MNEKVRVLVLDAAAFDFRLQKPFDDLEEVEQMVVRAVELAATRR